jgi:hypothetical protein
MITPEKIRQYLEGNLKMLGDMFYLLPKHVREQVAWRSLICQDCLSEGACKYCGCTVPGKLYVTVSCNGDERFPNLMDEEEWTQYKIENKIEIII